MSLYESAIIFSIFISVAGVYIYIGDQLVQRLDSYFYFIAATLTIVAPVQLLIFILMGIK